jgi:hypothetical protein
MTEPLISVPLLDGIDRRTLVAWAADCAESTLRQFEGQYPDDGRPRAAVAAARAWSDCPCEEHRLAASESMLDLPDATLTGPARVAATAASYPGTGEEATVPSNAAFSALLAGKRADERWKARRLFERLGVSEAEREVAMVLLPDWLGRLDDLLAAARLVLGDDTPPGQCLLPRTPQHEVLRYGPLRLSKGAWCEVAERTYYGEEAEAVGRTLYTEDLDMLHRYERAFDESGGRACIYALWHWAGSRPGATTPERKLLTSLGDLRLVASWVRHLGELADTLGIPWSMLSMSPDGVWYGIDKLMRGEGKATPEVLGHQLAGVLNELARALAAKCFDTDPDSGELYGPAQLIALYEALVALGDAFDQDPDDYGRFLPDESVWNFCGISAPTAATIEIFETPAGRRYIIESTEDGRISVHDSAGKVVFETSPDGDAIWSYLTGECVTWWQAPDAGELKLQLWLDECLRLENHYLCRQHRLGYMDTDPEVIAYEHPYGPCMVVVHPVHPALSAQPVVVASQAEVYGCVNDLGASSGLISPRHHAESTGPDAAGG